MVFQLPFSTCLTYHLAAMPYWMKNDLANRRYNGLYRIRRHVTSASGVRLKVEDREFLSFASNDYLNLAADSRLAHAAIRATRRYGSGAAASPLVCGYLPPHRALERALARWEQTPSVLTFTSGFVANLAVLSSLATREDVIFSDELNHASLIDASRLSRARVHVYRHADIQHLNELLAREGAGARRRVIVSDTVFSMDGDVAPLSELVEVAQRYDALLVIDEAHATGVIGEYGRGVTDLLTKVPTDTDRLIKIGTLSKALGSQGGFVCGSRLLIEWLVNHARPYIFSTALAPPCAAAARRAVALVQVEPQRRQKVLALANFLRSHLQAKGFSTAGSCCQIIPLIIGDPGAALALSLRLEENGLLVPAIRPPSVPEETARLRISLTAGHCEEDVIRLVDALIKNRPLSG